MNGRSENGAEQALYFCGCLTSTEGNENQQIRIVTMNRAWFIRGFNEYYTIMCTLQHREEVEAKITIGISGQVGQDARSLIGNSRNDSASLY